MVHNKYSWDIDKIENRINNLNNNELIQLHDFLTKNIHVVENNFQSHYPSRIPRIFFENPEMVELLKKSRLIYQYGDEFYTSFRIFKIKDFFVSTDFPTIKTQKNEERVFPWVDEGLQLLEYVDGLVDIKHPPKRILNMCCGAGTVALGLAKKWPSSQITAIDINKRAISCAKFNQKLNNINNISFQIGNLFENLNDTLYDLIIIDPPFALQPPSVKEYIHSAGKRYGEAVIEPFLRDLPEYLAKNSRLIMLCYSLGNETAPLRMENLIQKYLKKNNTEVKDQCNLLREQRVWRFHGKKSINKNPMPLRYMAIRCGDEDYKIYDNPEGIEKYINWIENDLINNNPPYTHLHYLIVDHILK